MKAKNNKGNKSFKRNKRKNNKNNNNKKHKIYEYAIKTAIVNYVTPTYTQPNLRFMLYSTLRDTEVFQQLAKQYLQYKLDKVTFFATPRQVDGTDPAPVWIYLDTNGNLQDFNYVGIQELQGSKALPVKHFSMTSFSSTGRQDDFHYWWDIEKTNDELAIRLHSEATPNDKKFWQFQVGFIVKFRGFVVKNEENKNKKIGEDQVVKISESHIEEEQGLTEEQEEEEAWNHIDSDWDEEGKETHGGD